MSDERANDNDAAPAPGGHPLPDAHGRAAILLVESLIHGLIARAVIRVDDAIEIVGVAAEVNVEIAADGGGPATPDAADGILQAIGASLTIDRTGE